MTPYALHAGYNHYVFGAGCAFDEPTRTAYFYLYSISSSTSANAFEAIISYDARTGAIALVHSASTGRTSDSNTYFSLSRGLGADSSRNALYTNGRYVSSGNTTAGLHRFDLSTKTWSQLNTTFGGIRLSIQGNKCYGFIDGLTLYVYDFETNTYSTKTMTTSGAPGSYVRVSAFEGKMIIFSGHGNGTTGMYDLETSTYTPFMPTFAPLFAFASTSGDVSNGGGGKCYRLP